MGLRCGCGHIRATLFCFLLLFVPPSRAQEATAQTRAEADRAEQEKKAANLKPWEPEATEQAYKRVVSNRIVKGFLEPGSGFAVRFGGLYPGSGFALGPAYSVKGLLKENLDLSFSAVGSYKLYYGLMIRASLPHLAQDRAFADVSIERQDSPQIDYYGPGNNTPESGRTNYRYENFTTDARLGLRPFRRWLQFGVFTGYSRNNVGPGTSDVSPPTDRVYPPSTTPGIDHQSPSAYVGPFLTWDTRDYPGDPHHGTYAVAAYAFNHGLDLSEFSYRRLRLGVDQYVPFFNEKRVIAMRVAGVFSYTDPGHAVPIYEQPTIGGPNDVRGLPRFRYYGNNSLVANLEYRWEIAPPFAMAIFADAGRVSEKPGQLSLSQMHGSAGFGLRFKSRNTLVMRIDLGFSPEGVHFWWTFSDLFKRFRPSPF